jgi:hypothetical protein
LSTTLGVCTPHVPPLRPGQLREPLLKALCKATNFTANVFVPHSTVLDDVIREAGFDPSNLPSGWSRQTRCSDGRGAGLDRNISLAFRYAYRDKNPALTVKGPKAGQWGLTDHGVALIKGMLPRPLPRPKTFHDPLLKVLGTLSNHTASTAVPHDEVIRGVMVEIGVDPDNLPMGWRDRGSNRQIKAFDRVRWAVKSMRGSKTPTIEQPGRGLWALTAAGEQLARDLNGIVILPVLAPASRTETPKAKRPTTGPNETAVWLGEHLRPAAGHKESDLHRMARSALCRRLPVSANAGMIDDHIQNYWLKAIRLNSLRKLLQDGGKVPYSKVVAYCVNSGRTDARDMGTEPVCRELYGARTEKERRERKDQPTPQFGDKPLGAWDTDGNMKSPDDADTTIDDTVMDFDIIWSQVENVVHDEKPQAWQRYSNILAMRARGLSTREIAAVENVSRNRAASMLAEARRCVRKGATEGNLDGFIERRRT